jgi:hypothetical protein
MSLNRCSYHFRSRSMLRRQTQRLPRASRRAVYGTQRVHGDQWSTEKSAIPRERVAVVNLGSTNLVRVIQTAPPPRKLQRGLRRSRNTTIVHQSLPVSSILSAHGHPGGGGWGLRLPKGLCHVPIPEVRSAPSLRGRGLSFPFYVNRRRRLVVVYRRQFIHLNVSKFP